MLGHSLVALRGHKTTVGTGLMIDMVASCLRTTNHGPTNSSVCTSFHKSFPEEIYCPDSRLSLLTSYLIAITAALTPTSTVTPKTLLTFILQT